MSGRPAVPYMPPCSFQQKQRGTDFKYRMIADVISFSAIISPRFFDGFDRKSTYLYIYSFFSLYLSHPWFHAKEKGKTRQTRQKQAAIRVLPVLNPSNTRQKAVKSYSRSRRPRQVLRLPNLSTALQICSPYDSTSLLKLACDIGLKPFLRQ